ncbi:hypothetical protein LTR85_002162 [Meristemomyces frigidus]|nr:hypothetical protein LTR85_002162 [Meristemomyces frigidus]
MGDYYDAAGERREAEWLQQDTGSQGSTAKSGPPTSQAQAAFHSQFDYVSHPQRYPPAANYNQYGPAAFDMGAMAGALPQAAPKTVSQRPHYDTDAPNVFSPASVYQMHQVAQSPSSRVPQADSNVFRAQSQPYGVPPYHMGHVQHAMTHRQPGLVLQPPAQYPRMDMYGYGMSAPHFSPLDPRFGPSGFAVSGPPITDMSQYARRPSEPIPSFPRGPPRKPKQSGHALWVGNLPPAATVTDLKDHFSRDATKDIESLFLISKSNCAFVNYRTESACIAAMNRFHDSRFHGVRLVCRLRRGSTASPASPMQGPATSNPIDDLPDGLGGPAPPSGDSGPVIVGESRAEEVTLATSDEKTTTAAASSPQKVPEKYFIVKSLTVQDLEASVHNGTWATQSHNEDALNSAFEAAENVYLIFSANKSGEYFGYARMGSRISGEPVNLNSSVVETDEAKLAGTPQSITTAATETAPKGRIIDDSARGTIFWEADLSEDELESPIKEGAEDGDGQHWGRQFRIEWVSTSRLPFFRTRGLRNPWNANREVKIARDGTELEPSVGRRLVQMFHRPPPTHGGAVMPPPPLIPVLRY